MKAVETGTVQVGSVAESLLNTALDCGESLFPRQTTDYSADLRAVRAEVVTELRRVQIAFRLDQNQKFDIRQRQLAAHFDRRIEAQNRRIETAEAGAQGGKTAAGFRATLANLKAQRDAQLAKLQQRAASLTESTAEVACGFIDVVLTERPAA